MSANLRPSDFACLSSSSVVRRSQNHLNNKQNVTSSSIVTNNVAQVPMNKHSSLMFNHDPANSSILSAGQNENTNLNQQYFSS